MDFSANPVEKQQQSKQMKYESMVICGAHN